MMKVSDYAGLAVAGILIYGGYKLFKGITDLTDLKNPFSGIGDTIKNVFKEAVRTIENPFNVQQQPAPADTINNFAGLNPDAISLRLIPSFDFTQPTTQKQLTSSPYFGGMMGGGQTITATVDDINDTITAIQVNSPVDYKNPYLGGVIIKPGDAGYIDMSVWGYV